MFKIGRNAPYWGIFVFWDGLVLQKWYWLSLLPKIFEKKKRKKRKLS
jgi:hypothetical protein